MISKNDFWYQEIKFSMSENVIFLITRIRICDIKDNFLKSRNRIFDIIKCHIFDKKNVNFWYFWYQKILYIFISKMTLISNFMYIFLKSENDFLILENRVFINENNRYYLIWYKEFDFLLSKNHFMISKSLLMKITVIIWYKEFNFSVIKKSFYDIKKSILISEY